MDNIARKNLIYFVYYSPDNGMLEYNLNLIEKYLHLFNGKVIVMVAGDVPKSEQFRPIFSNYIAVQNDPVNGEKNHFIQALGMLPDDDSITFYGHAKGVSRPVDDPLKWWVKLLYAGNLGTMPDMEGRLFSGCFGKLRNASPQCPLAFHYSGSFFWFRTREVLERFRGQAIPDEINTRWFTENFPAFIARVYECEFRVWASATGKMNFYSEKWWHDNPVIKQLAIES